MAARLFQRSKNAMQSGMARADEWVLEFESAAPMRPDPLMGWAGGSDTKSQVTLTFDTLEAAKNYAQRYGIHCHIIPPAPRALKIQSYADNFK
jgi:hypothetical protein